MTWYTTLCNYVLPTHPPIYLINYLPTYYPPTYYLPIDLFTITTITLGSQQKVKCTGP
jgi:hypothetical protein